MLTKISLAPASGDRIGIAKMTVIALSLFELAGPVSAQEKSVKKPGEKLVGSWVVVEQKFPDSPFVRVDKPGKFVRFKFSESTCTIFLTEDGSDRVQEVPWKFRH